MKLWQIPLGATRLTAITANETACDTQNMREVTVHSRHSEQCHLLFRLIFRRSPDALRKRFREQCSCPMGIAPRRNACEPLYHSFPAPAVATPSSSSCTILIVTLPIPPYLPYRLSSFLIRPYLIHLLLALVSSQLPPMLTQRLQKPNLYNHSTPSSSPSSPPSQMSRHQPTRSLSWKPPSSTANQPVEMSDYQPSLRSTLKGKQAIFSTWILSNPFVSSFVEDVSRGTAKETRANTMLNRENSSLSLSLSQTPPSSANSSSSRDSSNHSLQSLPSTPSRSVSFSGIVRVYSHAHQSSPTVEHVKDSTTLPPLEVRRKLKSAATRYPVNPSDPTSAAGRWLIRKTSSSNK